MTLKIGKAKEVAEAKNIQLTKRIIYSEGLNENPLLAGVPTVSYR